MRKLNAKLPVYATEHLPDLFLKQKKILLKEFKKAREQKQKTYWHAENGEYVFYADDVRIRVSDLDSSE